MTHAELFTPVAFDAVLLGLYGPELMPAQRPVLVSQWSKYYFSVLWRMALAGQAPLQVEALVLEVDEQPPERIGVKAVSGDFSHLEGEYRLIPVAGATDLYDLTWRGEMELASPVPGFLAQPILRANIRQRFESLVAEIQRRTRAVPKK